MVHTAYFHGSITFTVHYGRFWVVSQDKHLPDWQQSKLKLKLTQKEVTRGWRYVLQRICCSWEKTSVLWEKPIEAPWQQYWGLRHMRMSWVQQGKAEHTWECPECNKTRQNTHGNVLTAIRQGKTHMGMFWVKQDKTEHTWECPEWNKTRMNTWVYVSN